MGGERPDPITSTTARGVLNTRRQGWGGMVERAVTAPQAPTVPRTGDSVFLLYRIDRERCVYNLVGRIRGNYALWGSNGAESHGARAAPSAPRARGRSRKPTSWPICCLTCRERTVDRRPISRSSLTWYRVPSYWLPGWPRWPGFSSTITTQCSSRSRRCWRLTRMRRRSCVCARHSLSSPSHSRRGNAAHPQSELPGKRLGSVCPFGGAALVARALGLLPRVVMVIDEGTWPSLPRLPRIL